MFRNLFLYSYVSPFLKLSIVILFVSALNIMAMGDSEVTDIFRLVAGILHIGNIQFVENGNYSQIADKRCKYGLMKKAIAKDGNLESYDFVENKLLIE